MEGSLGSYYKTPNISYVVFATRSLVNETLGMTRRVLRDVPEQFVAERFKESFDYLMGKSRQLVPMSKDALLDCYSGAKRKRYALAVENLNTRSLEKRDFRIKSFVKRARTDDISKYPRMVHHRSYEAIFELLRYVKPLEHKLYKMKIRVNNFESVGPVVAKGLNGDRRAELIKRKFDQFKDPCVMSLDCYSFELHNSSEYLEVENEMMKAHYAHDKYFRWMCSFLIHHTGMTLCGQKWTKSGSRVSGDAHTGYGNTLAMVMCMIQLAYDLPELKFDILSDGDDTLLFLEKGSIEFDYLMEHFANFGHELRLDKIAYIFEDILFCQHRFTDGCMVRDPVEIMEKAMVILSKPTSIKSYYAGLGKGLRAVYGTIPELDGMIAELISLDPQAEPSKQYWLKHPNAGRLSSGRIWDLYGSDISSVEQEVQNLVQFLKSSPTA
jgi:hypothetical protein